MRQLEQSWSSPEDGDVLAMASYPTYEPSGFVPSIAQERFQQLYADPAAGSPLTNRAVTGLYPPGSTFEIFTAVAALRAGLVGPGQLYRDEGFFKLPNRNALQKCTWRNAGDTKFGPSALPAAIKVSSDSYFYNLGYQFSQLPKGLDNGIQASARSSDSVPAPTSAGHRNAPVPCRTATTASCCTIRTRPRSPTAAGRPVTSSTSPSDMAKSSPHRCS